MKNDLETTTLELMKGRKIDQWNCNMDIKVDVTIMVSSLIALKGRWIMCEELFDYSDVRIELLNQMAPRFFGEVQDMIENYALLELSKFTEKSKQNKRTANLHNIHQRVMETLTSEEERKVVNEAFTNFHHVCPAKDLNEYRNKYLAHNDPKKLDYSTADRDLSKFVNKSITALTAYLNSLSRIFSGEDMAFGFGQGYFEVGGGIAGLLFRSHYYNVLCKEGKIDMEDKNRIWQLPFYKAAHDKQAQKKMEERKNKELLETH